VIVCFGSAFCALASSLVSARISGGTRVPRVTVIELVAFGLISLGGFA
jgi:hypothetical protein